MLSYRFNFSAMCYFDFDIQFLIKSNIFNFRQFFRGANSIDPFMYQLFLIFSKLCTPLSSKERPLSFLPWRVGFPDCCSNPASDDSIDLMTVVKVRNTYDPSGIYDPFGLDASCNDPKEVPHLVQREGGNYQLSVKNCILCIPRAEQKPKSKKSSLNKTKKKLACVWCHKWILCNM